MLGATSIISSNLLAVRRLANTGGFNALLSVFSVPSVILCCTPAAAFATIRRLVFCPLSPAKEHVVTSSILRFGVAAVVLVLTASGLTHAANWPQWRGPNGDSVSEETGLPVKWDADSGLAWKCPLPPGSSTPAIWGDAVFVTAQEGDKLLFVKINKKDGKIEWTKEVGAAGPMRRGSPKRKEHTFHNLHNMASPSPVTDGEVVIIHFGNGELAAYDFAGKQLWEHNLQKEHGAYTIWWGHANSPVLYKDLVIIGTSPQLLDRPRQEDRRAEVESAAHDRFQVRGL
jgi:PQQ-like domain